MEITEITEWVKGGLILIVSIIVAWEKLKRWRYKKNGKDRRQPSNPHDLGKISTKLTILCQAFKNHERMDEKRTDEIKTEMRHFREEQGRHAVTIGVLKSKVNSR